MHDKAILESSEWLNDNIVFASQTLLKRQSEGKIFGWRSTQCSKMKKFPPLPRRNCKYIQLLNVNKTHWIVASNISVQERSYYADSVCIYDSLFDSVSLAVKTDICSFVLPVADALIFDLMNIQGQPNGYDCGMFAIACATELVHGYDPVFCNWDVPRMRQHLLTSLEKGFLDRFPCSRRRRVALGGRVRKSVREPLYCSCRLPNDRSKPMICCDQCQKWFHKDCEGVDLTQSFKSAKWLCGGCKDLMQSVTDL